MADGIAFDIFGDALAWMAARAIAMPRAMDKAVAVAAAAAQKEARAKVAVDTGRLRKSIGTRTSGGVTAVGPRGDPVYLYAKKEDERQPYMPPAHKAADASIATDGVATIAAAWKTGLV